MPTIPTNKLERALRAHYLQWLGALDQHQTDLQDYIHQYQAESLAIISREGGQVASLGALADFPVPKTLDLSPVAGVVYDAMQQAAVSAGITAGLNASDVARQMLHAGMDKSFNRLNRLARTETVSAYWKNAFNSTADLPDIVMLWGSEESKRTCDYCLSRDGLVIEDGNIRDHPNGRCTPIPTLRSRVEYKGTLQPDGSITMDPSWGKPAAKPTPLPKASKPTATQKDVLSGKSNPVAPSTASSINKVSGNAPTRSVQASTTPHEVLTPQRDTKMTLAQYQKLEKAGNLPFDPDAQGTRDELLLRHEAYMKILAKQTRMTVPALEQKLASTAQALVDGGTPSIMVNSDDLGKILSQGFKTTRDTGTGIGAGPTHDAYMRTRDKLEEAYFGPNNHPVYGFFDNPAVKGRGTLADYGDVKVVLNDDVRKRATATLGDSLDERIMPASATAMDANAIKESARLLSDGADSIKDYIEMQVADLGVADIDHLVFTTEPSAAVQKTLASKGIRWVKTSKEEDH